MYGFLNFNLNLLLLLFLHHKKIMSAGLCRRRFLTFMYNLKRLFFSIRNTSIFRIKIALKNKTGIRVCITDDPVHHRNILKWTKTVIIVSHVGLTFLILYWELLLKRVAEERVCKRSIYNSWIRKICVHSVHNGTLPLLHSKHRQKM